MPGGLHDSLTHSLTYVFLSFQEWGPDINPFHSLVLWDSEPPHLTRYATMCALGKVKIGEDVPADVTLPALDLSNCNRASGNSYYWVGVRGKKKG